MFCCVASNEPPESAVPPGEIRDVGQGGVNGYVTRDWKQECINRQAEGAGRTPRAFAGVWTGWVTSSGGVGQDIDWLIQDST